MSVHDGGATDPELQYEIFDRRGKVRLADVAWPQQLLAVEFDRHDWHSGPDDFTKDRQKRAALIELGWSVMSIVSDDIRWAEDVACGSKHRVARASAFVHRMRRGGVQTRALGGGKLG